jgi:hypothetical protein
MHITLQRSPSNDACTIGSISIDDTVVCHTLEDIVRDTKLFGQTAIPEGTYQIVITYSPHFQRDLPLLVNVPGYEGVRIHPGNTAADTEGCILPGMVLLNNAIGQSRDAFNLLYSKIEYAQDHGEQVTITILNG